MTLQDFRRSLGLAIFALWFALLGPLIHIQPRQLPSWSIILALAATLGALLYSLRLPLPSLRSLSQFRYPGLFLGYAFLSLLWTEQKSVAFRDISGPVYLPFTTMAIWLFLAKLEARHRRWILRLVLASLCVGIAMFAVDVACGFPLLSRLAHLRGGGVYYTNIPKRTASLYVLMLWSLLLCLAQSKLCRRWGPVRLCSARGAIIGLTFAVVFCSTSRSALIAVFAGVITYGLGRWSPHWASKAVRTAFVLLMLISPLGAFATVLLPSSVTQQMALSAQQRLMIWQFAAREIAARPLFGHGLDSSHALDAQSPLLPFENHRHVMSEHPHNAYLQIWMELGATGALLLLLLGLQFLRLADLVPLECQPYSWAAIAAALSLNSMTFGVWQAWWLAGQILAVVVFLLAVRVFQDNTAHDTAGDLLGKDNE